MDNLWNKINNISKIESMKLFQKLKKSNLTTIFTTNEILWEWFSYKEISAMIKNDLLQKLKNWIYYFDRHWTWVDFLLKNSYIVPFKDWKDVYLTGLSSLKLWNWWMDNITIWTKIKWIRPFSISVKDTEVTYDISVKSYDPDIKELNIWWTIVKVASTEQAILDYLDTKRDSNNFELFIKKIDEIKEQINYESLLKIAIKNNQVESLSRVWYLLENVLWYNFEQKEIFLKTVQNTIKSKIKLDYSWKSNSWTTSNDWRILNNLSTSKRVISRREFEWLPLEYIDKSNAIKLSLPIIELATRFQKYSDKINDSEKSVKDLLIYESYFWNLVEWTVFTIEEALRIMLKWETPKNRPQNDVYDIRWYYSVYTDFLEWKIDLNMNILELIKLVNNRIVWHKWTEDTGKPAWIFRCDAKIPYNVFVGSSFSPIDFTKLWSLLNFIEKEFSEINNDFIKAFFIHFFIAEAHPFPDWNWRTARLISNLFLLRWWYLPPLCTPQNKNYLYSKWLSDMTHDSDITKLTDYFSKAMNKSYQFVLEKNKLLQLWLVKGEFEEDWKDIMRSNINIDDIFKEFYKE